MTTYIAAPAGLTAHRFDDDDVPHSLPIAAWWQKPDHEGRKGEPNLHPVVIGKDGALQCVEKDDCVLTLADEAPRDADLLGRLTNRLQAAASTSPAGRAATDAQLGDTDLERLRKAANSDGHSIDTYLTEGPGARDLATLGRCYDIDRKVIVQTDDEPQHPALDAARAVLNNGGWLKE